MIFLLPLLILAFGMAAVIWLEMPDCPRMRLGYNCHAWRATGCEACGRGRTKQFNNFKGEK
jgi:hypothetical protein